MKDDWSRCCFVCKRLEYRFSRRYYDYNIRPWRLYCSEWYCDKCYQRCVRRKATLVIRTRIRTLFSSSFYNTKDTLPLLSTITQRKNEIADFISDRENRISVLRSLYEGGWRLLLLPNHSTWQQPRGTSIKLGRTKSILSYDFGVDDEILTINLVCMIKPDLLNSDVAATVETMDEATMTYDTQRLEDGTLLKVILTNSPRKTYRDVWKLSGIHIIEVPTAEQQFEEFERNASLLTYAMRGVP